VHAGRVTVRILMRPVLRRYWHSYLGVPDTESATKLWGAVRDRHPRFTAAVVADARIAAANRGERYRFRSRADAAVQVLRLAIVADAFLAQCCYRAKARCQSLRIPLVPRFLHRLAMRSGQICIGDPVLLQPGVYIPHGQVVVDGLVDVGRGVVLSPFVTLGLKAGDIIGPTIGPRVHIGTGAKVLGPVRVGADARIGANAVVLEDVPAGATVVGVPARVVPRRRATGRRVPPP
jgi:serine O-acetyltransferase